MLLETVFSLCTYLAMIGWLGLILAPRYKFIAQWVAPMVIPLLIAICYIWLMGTNFSQAPEGAGFDSLAAVTMAFSVPELLLAGWIHYLAFDLFVGAWELRDAQKQGIHHLLVVPCLLATFMAGPAGLLLYWILKLAHQRLRPQEA